MTKFTESKKGFFRDSEAWYRDVTGVGNDFAESFSVGWYHPDGGTEGEFTIKWYELGNDNYLSARIEIFYDAWEALYAMPDLLSTLNDLQGGKITPDQMSDLLIGLGFEDLTDVIDTRNKNMVVTRFAPSPTGDLHIGGARTALFNYLYAKATGGKFLLRIEDTDKERSNHNSIQSIFDGLTALGLKHDGHAVYQSANAARHVAVVSELVAAGHAYLDYSTEAETEEDKAACKALNKGYRSRWRDGGSKTENDTYVIRLKVPNDETILITDKIKGEVVFETNLIDDLVLLRSDGTPTYNLAVVVDDHDMGVNHVIRGDDHLGNTPKQYLIYKLMGWDIPVFAHMPLIYGPDGKKMSKRHGATDVREYTNLGYLKEALVNYLCHLSWSFGTEDVFTLEDAAKVFDVADIKSSPARFDFAKLDSINAEWMRRADDADLAKWIEDRQYKTDDHKVIRAVSVLKNKFTTLAKLRDEVNKVLYSGHNPDLDHKPELMSKFMLFLLHETGSLNTKKVWTDPEALAGLIKTFIEANGLTMKEFGPPLRLALTSQKVAPENHNIMFILGETTTLDRLRLTAGF